MWHIHNREDCFKEFLIFLIWKYANIHQKFQKCLTPHVDLNLYQKFSVFYVIISKNGDTNLYSLFYVTHNSPFQKLILHGYHFKILHKIWDIDSAIQTRKKLSGKEFSSEVSQLRLTGSQSEMERFVSLTEVTGWWRIMNQDLSHRTTWICHDFLKSHL